MIEEEDTDPDPPVMIGSHGSDSNGGLDWLMVTLIAVVVVAAVCFLVGMVIG